MTRPVRAAVVGCGDISRVHFAAIAQREGSELVGVADTDAGRREVAAETHDVPGFATVESLIADVRPDVIHVCTPHDEHAPVAIAALDAGVAVLVEKPIASDLASARRIAEAAHRSGSRLGVCFQNRYNAPVRAAKELIASGGIGEVLGATATVLWRRTPEYYLDRPWRGTWHGGGGGLLMNQAIHSIDLLHWLLGPASTVDGTAATRALADVIEVEDTAELSIVHASGARSALYATLAHGRNAPVTIEVVGEDAVLSLAGDLTVDFTDGRTFRVEEGAQPGGERGYWGASHALLIDDFHSTLADADPFWIGADEGIAALTTIAAVYARSFPERVQRTADKENA